MPITTLQKLMGHRQLDTTMKYVALYEGKVQQDYQMAMNILEEETGFDWDLWGPTIDTAFQQDVPLAMSP